MVYMLKLPSAGFGDDPSGDDPWGGLETANGPPAALPEGPIS
jgi:hypothetical protein